MHIFPVRQRFDERLVQVRWCIFELEIGKDYTIEVVDCLGADGFLKYMLFKNDISNSVGNRGDVATNSGGYVKRLHFIHPKHNRFLMAYKIVLDESNDHSNGFFECVRKQIFKIFVMDILSLPLFGEECSHFNIATSNVPEDVVKISALVSSVFSKVLVIRLHEEGRTSFENERRMCLNCEIYNHKFCTLLCR